MAETMWCHFQTRPQETLLLLLIHWAPCLCHLNKPQANKEKTREREMNHPGNSQIYEAAQAAIAKADTQLTTNTWKAQGRPETGRA